MTNEDKKLIAEFCGIKVIRIWVCFPDGSAILFEQWIPDIKFFFDYAVPKLDTIDITYPIDGMYCVVCSSPAYNGVGRDKAPAEAFGQALLKLIKGEK